jgi:hypothetical protein
VHCAAPRTIVLDAQRIGLPPTPHGWPVPAKVVYSTIGAMRFRVEYWY